MEKTRRRGWFERIRRLFTSSSSDAKPAPKPADKQQKAKSKRWLPGKLRAAQQSFALPAPAEQIRQAEDEQSKHAVAVALATAAAAEAAVAAAHAAAQVVRLTGQPPVAPPLPRQAAAAAAAAQEQEHAAVAIQSAYRGYLARRALRALKGLVRLQALIRGQAVRRQTAATLRGLESLMRIQARHRSRPGGAADHHHYQQYQAADDDAAQLLRRGRELFSAAAASAAGGHLQDQQQGPSSKGWDSSTLSKEEMSAMSRSKEEAALKRVRALQYASLRTDKLGLRRPPPHSSSRDDDDELNQRWSWLEEWVGSQPPFDKDVPVAHQSPYTTTREHVDADAVAVAVDRLGCSARRSFARPRRTDVADACSTAPMAFPGYMASTASAKAKFRSMSTPKERSAAAGGGGGYDAYSEHCFPSFADRLLSPVPSMMSPIPSVASDMGFATRSSSTRPPVAQRSPRVAKSPAMTPSRSRSRRSQAGHHSFGSEAALQQLQMEQCYTPVR